MRWGILAMLALLMVILPGMAVPASAGIASQNTLERVREAGAVRCGVTTSGTGLAALDTQGRWQGFFADFCRALAAAVTGGAENVDFVEVSPRNRFQAIRDGVIDLIADGATWTLGRETTQGVDFPAVYMFDDQGFMAHRSLGAQRLSDVGSATVCVIEGTTTLRNLEGWVARTSSKLTIKTVSTTEGALSAFFNHHCDLFTNDRIGLYAQRLLNAPKASDYVIFPEAIAKEPLSPMVRAGDRTWAAMVRWVMYALLLAEEKGITAAQAATLEDSPDPEVRRLLGITPGLGKGMGLDDRWARRAVAQLGHYGEIFDRHLGAASALKIERGFNALWNRGGLMFAPPLGE